MMKRIAMAAVLGAALLATGHTDRADARGCIKGALVGGIAGHFAGHHGLMGAAAGCAVGHHYANKKTTPTGQPDPNGDQTPPAQ